jgi:hypothetical protein
MDFKSRDSGACELVKSAAAKDRMGEVFLAQNIRFGQQIALKVLPEQSLAELS